MRILLAVTWYPNCGEESSAGIFHYEQARCLSKYCDVAIYYPFDALLPEQYRKTTEKGIITYRSRFTGNPIRKRLDLYRGFAEVIRDFKPDIIHAQVASQAGFYSLKLTKHSGIPVIITEHNPIELMELDNKKAYKRNKYAYHNSKANICVSENSKERLKNLFPGESFSTIFNGIIDPETLKPDGHEYRIPNRINACIVAGFYSKDIKGYQFLLPAIKEVRDKGIEITLHVIGGGDYLTFYENLAKDTGIEDDCIFYGLCSREKVYSVVRQMDFSISASIFECSGVSVQEAMLLGKPLVVTKSGGADSLVTKDTAIVVERNSVKALADGIIEMSKNLQRFDADTIREYAYCNFEIERVNKKYLQLYESIDRGI